MLSPVRVVANAQVEYQTPVQQDVARPVAIAATQDNDTGENPVLSGARLNLLSLSGQLQIAQGSSVFAETIGAFLNLPRGENEALGDYAARLQTAVQALSSNEQATLERLLGQLAKGISIRLLDQILKDPSGPDAARLALSMEAAKAANGDLAARAAVSSYQQNDTGQKPVAGGTAPPAPANAVPASPGSTASAAVSPAGQTSQPGQAATTVAAAEGQSGRMAAPATGVVPSPQSAASSASAPALPLAGSGNAVAIASQQAAIGGSATGGDADAGGTSLLSGQTPAAGNQKSATAMAGLAGATTTTFTGLADAAAGAKAMEIGQTTGTDPSLTGAKPPTAALPTQSLASEAIVTGTDPQTMRMAGPVAANVIALGSTQEAAQLARTAMGQIAGLALTEMLADLLERGMIGQMPSSIIEAGVQAGLQTASLTEGDQTPFDAFLKGLLSQNTATATSAQTAGAQATQAEQAGTDKPAIIDHRSTGTTDPAGQAALPGGMARQPAPGLLPPHPATAPIQDQATAAAAAALAQAAAPQPREALAFPFIPYPPAQDEPKRERRRTMPVDAVDEDGGTEGGSDQSFAQQQQDDAEDSPAQEHPPQPSAGTEEDRRAHDLYWRLAGWS